MHDHHSEPLVLNATDIYFYADGPFEDIGYMSLKGLDLTTVVTEGVYDELLDWSWPSESRTLYFQYCDADVRLCEMLYGLFSGPSMLEDIAAFNAAIWKKENQ